MKLSDFMNKKLLAGIFVILLVFSVAFVLAKGSEYSNGLDNKNKTHDRFENSTNENETEHNNSERMNYGLCVSNVTRDKNNCFDSIKEKYKQCSYDIRLIRRGNINTTLLNFTSLNITLPTNKTEKKDFNKALKDLLKDCRESYKDELKMCKDSFKENKLLCAEYKCKENEILADGKCKNKWNNSTDANLTQIENNATLCTEKQRKVTTCTTVYEPVCGFRQVECIKAPCYPIPETYKNSCEACANKRTIYYIDGECANYKE